MNYMYIEESFLTNFTNYKLILTIFKALVYSMQGGGGKILIHIYEGFTFMVDVCGEKYLENITKEIYLFQHIVVSKMNFC